MNIRRGLLRLWMAGTGIWLIYWIWYYERTCDFVKGEGLLCEDRSHAVGWVGNYFIGGPFVPPDLLHIAVLTIGLPLAILCAGVAARWVIRGFRSN